MAVACQTLLCGVVGTETSERLDILIGQDETTSKEHYYSFSKDKQH